MSAPTEYRQRYIVFEAGEDVSRLEIKDCLSKINEELDFSPRIRLVAYSKEKLNGIIRCGHLQLENLKEELEKSSFGGLKVLGVSGTTRGTRQKFLPEWN